MLQRQGLDLLKHRLAVLRAPLPAAVHAALLAQTQVFDDQRASLFVVSADPADEAHGRTRDRLPGVRVFWDDAARVSTVFGVARPADTGGGVFNFLPAAVLLDPTLRVMRWYLPTDGQADFSSALIDAVAALPDPPSGAAGAGADRAAHLRAGVLPGSDRALPAAWRP
jgi:hypothetical protein